MGTTWGENPERGVYKTPDGGRSWERVLYVDERSSPAVSEWICMIVTAGCNYCFDEGGSTSVLSSAHH